MGGWGSGTWTRWNRKKTVEECLHLSARKLDREGFLHPGPWRDTSLSGRNRRHRLASVFVKVTERHGQRFLIVDHEGNESIIRLERIPPHDARWAFVCPECDRRYLKLYFQNRHLACRNCHDLTYESCQDGSARKVWRTILSRALEKR